MRQTLILEDDAEREARFRAVLAQHPTDVLVWRRAPVMLAELPDALVGASLISLDHDLIGDPDPGDGLAVAEWLATQPPRCPVIVHSTNAPRARLMCDTLAEAGWSVHRVVPYGAAWIENDWALVAAAAFRFGMDRA